MISVRETNTGKVKVLLISEKVESNLGKIRRVPVIEKLEYERGDFKDEYYFANLLRVYIQNNT